MNRDKDELVKILETRDQALITSAQSALQDAGIENTVTNIYSRPGQRNDLISGLQLWVWPEEAGAAEFILRELTQSDEPPEQAGESSQDRPFMVRMLIALGVILIPIILAILYSLRN